MLSKINKNVGFFLIGNNNMYWLCYVHDNFITVLCRTTEWSPCKINITILNKYTILTREQRERLIAIKASVISQAIDKEAIVGSWVHREKACGKHLRWRNLYNFVHYSWFYHNLHKYITYQSLTQCWQTDREWSIILILNLLGTSAICMLNELRVSL